MGLVLPAGTGAPSALNMRSEDSYVKNKNIALAIQTFARIMFKWMACLNEQTNPNEI
jgi:hypothetical protein